MQTGIRQIHSHMPTAVQRPLGRDLAAILGRLTPDVGGALGLRALAVSRSTTAAPYRLRFSVATKASDSLAAKGRTKASIFEGVLSTGSGLVGVFESACRALSLAAASLRGQASAKAHTRGTNLGGGGTAAASSASSATLSLNV